MSEEKNKNKPKNVIMTDIRTFSDMPKTSEAKLKSIRKWQKNNMLQINLALHRKNDADIIEKLEQVENKNGYIKELIRKDLENEQGNDQ